MMYIYYHLHTGYCAMDEQGVAMFSDSFTDREIDEAIWDLARDNAMSYGLDDEDVEEAYGTWRKATAEDLEQYTPIVI